MAKQREARSTVRAFLGPLLLLAVVASLVLPTPVPAAGTEATSITRAAGSQRLWRDAHDRGRTAKTTTGIVARHARYLRLDHRGMRTFLASAPGEFSAAAAQSPLVLSLPAPDGGFQRFQVQESPVMEPKLARRHPRITTYDGRGISDTTASIRFSMTPLGFSASVRGRDGMWYIDPVSFDGGDRYQSYFRRNLVDRHGSFVEREARRLERSVDTDAAAAPSAAGVSVGSTLRTYRLALTSDPSFADFWGPANVTTGKVLLVNRVDQIYEQEFAIHLMLVGNNDLLNLNTTADMTGSNGPCGATACFTTAQVDECDSDTLTRNRLVTGQLVGAGNYDIGHVALGMDGGGIASFGVVGTSSKAEGCSGISEPNGDGYAVDYLAHEMGHEFKADHTFNGTNSSCGGGNRSSVDAVEPGGGSTIMAYAGICGSDDLQAHSDPYFSQKSFDEITAYVSSDLGIQSTEIQSVALRDFSGADSFTLRYGGNDSVPIVRGSNYSQPGIVAALTGIPGWPAGLTPTVAGFWGGSFGDAGFQVTLSGTVASSGNAGQLSVTNPSGTTGFVGLITKGGPILNGGSAQTPTGNAPPEVTAPASYTIPTRTPFSLTGSATDANNDTLTYLWEQNDIGQTATGLTNNLKGNGPLFRVFGSTYNKALYNPNISPSPGLNATTTNPTRVFPDMAQILANNTNAPTGTCPSSGSLMVECFSEFLPTSAYSFAMHFRLTARDGYLGGGGVASAETTVNVATATGPFLVTSPNTAVTYPVPSTQTVTWDVAGTAGAPVNTANVQILLSTDGGATFPRVLSASTPNDGSESVSIPNVVTTHARIQVKAVGNVYFDVSNADFTIAGTYSDQTISFDPLADRVLATPDFPVSATASSGLPVSFSASGVCTVTGATVHLVATGTCSITASQAGDASFNPAPPVTRSFAVTNVQQTITFDPLPDKVVGDPDFSVSATASSGLPVSFSASGGVCTVVAATVHLTGPGTCSITASQAGDASYPPAQSVTRTFAVTTLSQTITFDPLPDREFADPDFTVSATASSGLPVSFAVSGTCTKSGAASIHIESTGSCTVTATQPGNATYTAAPPVARTFTVAKGNQTITFAALPNKTFGDPDFAVTATASSGRIVAFTTSGTCTNSGASIHLTGAGSCTVSANQSGNSNWNPAPQVDRTFQVAPKSTTTTLVTKPKTKVKHGKLVTLTATITAVGGTPSGSVTYFQDGVTLGTAVVNAKGKAVFKFTATLVGTHTMTATFSNQNGTYASSSGTKSLKIT